VIEQLAPVVGIPALVTAGWAMVGLRLTRSTLWPVGGIAAAVLAGALILIAAFLPLIGFFGALGVPALCVGGGILLMFLFGRPHAVAAALAVPFGLLVLLQPPWFPVVLPFILVLPLWVSGWIEREGGAGRYALVLLAALIAVPIAVYGGWFLIRGV
jgi:hypothetical protein